MISATHIRPIVFTLLLCCSLPTRAADSLPQPTTTGGGATTYALSPNDLILIKVYRNDDLETKLRIESDGTSTFPLLGTIKLGGKTVEEAMVYIRDLLGKDYLVNPQVTITVLEYAKRRFSVLGQVQKPGAYEIPSEESVKLLEAIAMAGGFTRLANTTKITVTRQIGEKKANFVLDAKAMAKDAEFILQPDDTIMVPQRIL